MEQNRAGGTFITSSHMYIWHTIIFYW